MDQGLSNAAVPLGALARANRLPLQHRSWAIPSLVLGDVLSLAACAAIGLIARLAITSYLPVELHFGNTAAVVICLGFVPMGLWIAGLYPGTGLPSVERLRRRSIVTTAAFLIVIVFDYVALDKTLSRGFILTTFALALLLPPLADGFVRHQLRRFKAYSEPAVIVGFDENTSELIELLRQDSKIGFMPIAILSDDPTADGLEHCGLPVMAPFARASELRKHAKTALVSLRLSQNDSMRKFLDLPFLNTVLLPNSWDIGQVWLNACEVGHVTGLRVRNNLLIPLNFALKRSFDFFAAVILVLLSAPVVTLAALGIYLMSPGPIIFRQTREGHNGKTITVYKLRTMCIDAEERLAAHLRDDPQAAEEWKRSYKLAHDPRLIPFIGAFLRQTSIDELPQLWNVLEGKLSLVGPRPFPFYHLECFSPEFRALRRKVIPGITGMWQVTTRSDGDTAAQERLDSYYIRNWSLWLDIYILALTVRAVLLRTGAR